MAGDSTTQPDGSPEAAVASGRTAPILTRFQKAGLSGRLAAAALAPLVGAVAALWLVIPTLAPSVLSEAGGDAAEFQTVSWVFGTAHPTGYPSYVILGFVATHVLPFGDPAYRMNLLGAFLAAGAIAGTIAIVQLLTGMRWIALASGLLLLVMPAFAAVAVAFPSEGFQSSPVFWRLSTYADPHMFHLALVALIFLLLLVWERRRTEGDPERPGQADRWLVAAAAVYGAALANHSLTLMLAPAIGLFVLAVAPRIILSWRLVLVSAGILAATAVAFWLELPIRAAMHAPLVYAHPDTWNGFLYVITGQQFGGIPRSIGADFGLKLDAVMTLLSSWLGPLGYVAALGLATSLVRRPRYVLLSVLGAAMTAGFAAAYGNSDLERYFLVPVFVAFTFVGLGLADAVSLGVWLVEDGRERFAGRHAAAAVPAAPPGVEAGLSEPVTRVGRAGDDSRRGNPALLAVEIAAALVFVLASASIVSDRQHAQDLEHPGGVNKTAETSRQIWMRAVLAPTEQGGLPANSVIVSNWYDSTALWYGQIVEGLRPDIHVVDDSMRVAAGDNLGEVWDVIDSYLGQRPVFLLRLRSRCDGTASLRLFYSMRDYQLPAGVVIPEVTGKTGPVVCR